MRLLSAALYTTVAAALLAGCSGNGSSPSSSTPGGAMPQGLKSHGRIAMTTVPRNSCMSVYVERYMPRRHTLAASLPPRSFADPR